MNPSLTDVSVQWPTWAEAGRALTLRGGYTSTVVVLGTTALGAAGGLVGAFALLRKRALMADTLAHATLPGVAGAFLVLGALGVVGKPLTPLLAGAAITGVLGVLAVQVVLRTRRLREDAAMALVLSVGFGLGVVLLSIVQAQPRGDGGGLKSFIYGQTAAMSREDVLVIASAALLCIAVAAALFKELAFVAFDSETARVAGLPVAWLDLALMALVVLVTVVALQAVGLVLAVAVLVVPSATARLWTDRLRVMVWLSAGLGAVGAYLGAIASSLLERLPAGSVIVLCSGAIFAVSLVVAPRRGLASSAWRRARLRGVVLRDHALRSIWERSDDGQRDAVPESLARSSPMILRTLAWRGLVRRDGGQVGLTPRGEALARRVTRNHRLWEQYLIAYADVAPSHVDISADRVEHTLGEDLVAELESRLRARGVEIESLPDHSRLEGSA